MGDKRGTKLQIRSVTLKEFFESTNEEEKSTRNFRDNRKEKIEVNQEECELRRGNREQKVTYAKSSQLTKRTR